MGNEKNLVPNSERTPEELKEMTRLGGIASGKARRKKKLMKEIYAEFLAKEHNIKDESGVDKKISGSELLGRVMSKVLSRGDSASVSLMKEIREATSGTDINLLNDFPVKIIIEGVTPEPPSEENNDTEEA